MSHSLVDILRACSKSWSLGLCLGAVIVPGLLVAFADYSALEFVGTYFATLPVGAGLLWLSGLWQPHIWRPKR